MHLTFQLKNSKADETGKAQEQNFQSREMSTLKKWLSHAGVVKGYQ